MKLKVFLNAYGKRLFMGILADVKNKMYFEYDLDFLKTGLEVSPFKLPLQVGVFENKSTNFDGLFGLFNDSLPDGWGCLLLDRKLQKRGVSYHSIRPLDRLFLIGKNPMGALEYEPAENEHHNDFSVKLDDLANDADDILSGKASDTLDELLHLNGSSCGARPKITAFVSDDKSHIVHGGALQAGYSPWLIKFSNQSDRKDLGLHEYIYSLIAKKAGIEMPETFLFPSKTTSGHFGVKRFDREGQQKVHVHTVSGLLNADFRTSVLDYSNLLRLTQILTRNMQDVEKMVLLMVFNVKAGNKDDHCKNFSFMLGKDKSWRLAPAYDLTKSFGINGEQTAMVNGKGIGISNKDLITEAQKVGISERKTKEMIEKVEDALADYNNYLVLFR